MKPFVLLTYVALSLAAMKIHAEEGISLESEPLMAKHSRDSHCEHSHRKHSHRSHHSHKTHKKTIGPNGAVFTATYTIGTELGQQITSTATPLLFETPTTGTPSINYPVINSPISYSNSGPNAGGFTLSTPGIYLIEFSGLINYQQGSGDYGPETLSISLVNTTTSQVVEPSPIVKTTFTDQQNAYDLPVTSFNASRCVQIAIPQTYQIQGTFTTQTPNEFQTVVGIDNTLLNIILLVPL